MTPFFNKLQRGLNVCFAALCMLLVASPATVHAYDFTINGISYDVLSYDELRCEVVKVFSRADGTIKIPETVEFDNKTFRVTSIGEYSFRGCKSLTNILLPDNVTSIGSGAFYECTALIGIQLPKGITAIEGYTFYGCSSLTSLQFPEGVMSIGNSAFSGCSSLTSLQFPEGVTSIGNSAFSGCGSLTSLHVPEGVTSIGNETFYGCSSLTSLHLPGGITSIGDKAFYGCNSLTSLHLPDGITSIGPGAFYGCHSLTSLRLPDDLTSIVSHTFFCSKLAELYLPKSLQQIENDAFVYAIVGRYECPLLIKLICRSAVPAAADWYSFDFHLPSYTGDYYYYKNTTLYVPRGSLEAYKEADGWKRFDSIVEYDVEDGIDEVVAPGVEREEIGRYDLSGREVDGSHKGITIVRYDDGSATKIYQD